MKRGWNIVILAIAALVVTCALTGCSNSPKDEKGIIEDLKASNQFISDTAEIESCEIIKRQTNTENGTDEVYVTVEGGNNELSFTLSYILTYELYNEGWFLEGVASYPDGPCDIQGLDEERLKDDIIDQIPFLAANKENLFNFGIEEYTIDSEICYSDISEYETSYIKTYYLSVVGYNLRMRYMADCMMEYVYVDDQWICRYSNVTSASYVPDFSPNGETIMESLEEKGYTSYELDHIDTDWDNCQETQYYKAYRDFELGSEEYEIVVPLTFTLDEEDYSYGWYFSSNEMEEKLISVDWSLKGTWSAVNDNYIAAGRDLPRYSLKLYIGDMMEDLTYNNDGESGFGFFTTCESTYIYRNNIDSVYRSYTEGPSVGMVEINRYEPGVYIVDIGDLTGDYEIHMGSEGDDMPSGVYWTGGGDIVQLTKEE